LDWLLLRVGNTVIVHNKNYLSLLDCSVGKVKEKLRSQFSRIYRLGVLALGDVVDIDSQQFIEFENVKQCSCISLNYTFIWVKLRNIRLVSGFLPLIVTNNTV
jgi:hypothetical protein